MKKFYFSVMMCALIVVEATAQSTISGKVTDDTGEGLPGVNVLIKGTTTGTQTDLDGNYQLSVSDDAILVFSYVGFQSQEVTVGGRSVIDIELGGAIELQEVVVVGYGEVDKRKLISSVASVAGEQIAEMPVVSFDQALQGKAAGVQVTTTSGILGSTPKVRIRGINSITSGTSPLYVIDGVPIQTGELSTLFAGQLNGLADINPNDIESYEILKDGAATAIYGSRASNGVILITTKKGSKSKKPKVDYSFTYGLNQTANRFDLLNAEEFILISNEKFASAGQTPQAFAGPNNVDTDWQDEIYRTGQVMSHNLALSGGSESVSYFFSVGMTDQEGAIDNNSLTRYSTRANIDYVANDWLKTGVRMQVSRQQSNGLNVGSNALSGNVANATRLFPNVPVFDAEHPTGYNLTPDNNALGRGNNLQDIAFNLTNIRYVLDNNIQETVNTRFLGSGYLQVDLPYGFSAKTQIGIDNADTQDFLSLDPLHGDGNPTGRVDRVQTNGLQWNWQNTLSWRKTIADVHSFYFIAGNEFQKLAVDWFLARGSDFADPFFIRDGLITGSFNTQNSSGFFGENGFASTFSRLNYDYDNRYLLSVSFRRDGISSLPEDTREDNFFGGSLGWNVTQESFFNIPIVSQLKLRGSWAQTGNTSFSTFFPALGTYQPELYGDATALSFATVGNPDLRWEVTTKTNFGVDFGVLDNRITGSVDYFVGKTEDLILSAPTPPLLGIPGSPTANTINLNVGEMENRGVELALNSTNYDANGLVWTTSFNATWQENEVTLLSNDNADIVSISPFNIVRVGESIGSLYGWESAGVNPANGNPLYNTPDRGIIQGNPDNNTYYIYDPENPNDFSEGARTTALGEADKKIIGQTLPKVYGGISNQVSYKGFDLSISLTYALGHQVFNGSRQNGLTNFFQNNSREILNRWTPSNTNTDIPRLSLNNDNFLNLSSSLNAGNAETRFMEDADYLRVQNVTIGYTLPASIVDRAGISSARIFVQAQNLHVFTGYSGLDPELNVSRTSNIASGVDLNTNPLNRTYTIGVNLSF